MDSQDFLSRNDHERDVALVIEKLIEQTGGVFSAETDQFPALVTSRDAFGKTIQYWQAVERITIPGQGSRSAVGTSPSDHSPLEAVDNAFIKAAALFGIRADLQ